ncbi:MAG TPA: ASKHA domain-containing protein, partial [Levilinea sp.]|nr:ASKHA domain-containing protein [Levilinea sp.]
VLAAPELADLRSDLTRASQALAEVNLPALEGDLAALTALSQGLRAHDWQVRLAIRGGADYSQLVGVLPPGAPLLGLAVDLGSTKLALYLVELESGATLASSGVMNPQIAFGEDVVSRIAYANQGESQRRVLQTRLLQTLNETIDQLCRQVRVNRSQVVEAVIAGNTAMHHFFCGLPVAQLGASPYIPAVSQPLFVKAAETGLNIATSGYVYLPANIAGYVGGDHTSALLASQAHLDGRTFVLVDIGTNTEISLVRGEHIFTCSTASGPAFEGAHIRDGMRAAPGAIERVMLAGDVVQVVTIGGLPPVGLCGTGILTAISALLENGVLDQRGVFNRRALRVRAVDRQAEFILVEAGASGHGREVVITRKDVHEIQLAKGAIRAGIGVLLDEAGIEVEEVEQWVIAGAFGTYLDLRSAQRVGMFPPAPLDRFQQVGNAAGIGAKQMLLSLAKRDAAYQMTSRVRYVELTIYPNFAERFINAMYF